MNRILKNGGSRSLKLLAFTLCLIASATADQRYSVRGLVLKLDASHKTMVASTDAIPGYMEARTMPYLVRDPKQLDSLKPGTLIDFTLVVEKDSSYAED